MRVKAISILIYFISFLLLLVGVYNFYYSDKVLPGVYLNNKSMAGLTWQQVKAYVENTLPDDRNITITADSKEYTISFDNIDLNYDIEKTADSIYYFNRDTYISHLGNILGFFYPVKKLDYSYTFDEKKLNIYISSFASDNFPSNKNAYFTLSENNTLQISEASQGKDLQVDLLKDNIVKGFSDAQFKHTAILNDFVPTVLKKDLEIVSADVINFVNSPVTLTYNEKSFTATGTDLLNFLEFETDSSGNVLIRPNESGISAYVDLISSEVNIDPKSTTLEIIDNNVIFEPPVVGVAVKKDDLALQLTNYVNSFDFDKQNEEANQIEIAVSETKPEVKDNDYGITELIAEGVSYFAGSAASRVSNIVTASEKIKGTLVAPGENFSFNEAVGPITVESGFNEAYVISKGRTVLGTGGGVCQASTTVFRAALLAGLPIVDRTAHAYRVSYYEQKSPLGWDATIYQPSVDLVFKNDTDHYILIYSEVDTATSTMRVKIYGTKDGRTVEISDSKQVSQLPPPEARYIDTDRLPKGQVEQVEWPAWGGLVTFSRVVKNKNGRIIYEDEFKNYYTPWAAVYERGI